MVLRTRPSAVLSNYEFTSQYRESFSILIACFFLENKKKKEKKKQE